MGENLEEHALASAGLAISLEMATAMTRTTTAAASTMEAIAAPKPSKVAKSRRHTAKNVSAWIPKERDRKSHASASAEMLKQKKMANVTTRTTIVGVNTMGVIAAPNPTKKAVDKTKCKKCMCLDPKNQPTCDKNNKCKLTKYIKDGNCDDENNKCECNYDGGDCCAKTVNGGTVKKKYCKACSCIDPKGHDPSQHAK